MFIEKRFDRNTYWQRKNPIRRASRIGRKEQLAGRPRPELCEVCGLPDTITVDGRYRKTRVAMHWDHDHATGQFRGWLCSGCNHTLGFARDSSATLRKLADYLDNPPGPTIVTKN